jgi:dTDP-4-amino-4,6-dideoxygalactose transaminase
MAMQKYINFLKDIFIRKYPWQINFFNETIALDDVSEMIKFLLNGKPLRKGSYIHRYENKFKDVLGGNGFCFTFGTGRMALYAILDALDIGKDDEVILPAFTCEVVVHALLYRGIKPVYADIEPFTFNIDASKIEPLITPKTKAIIAQHTFGISCDMDSILDIAKRHNLFVIEDCAIALGSTYKGRHVGTFGDAAIFSTDRTKITSTEWGGIAFTQNEDIGKKLGVIYDSSPFLKNGEVANIGFQVIISYFLLNPFIYWIGKYIFSVGFQKGFLFVHKDDKKTFKLPKRYPCRLSNLQAFLGLKQLEKLEINIAHRKRIIGNYLEILRSKGVNLYDDKRKADSITLRFSLLLKDRDAFIDRWNRYFEVGKWFDSPAIGWYKDLDRISYKTGSSPVAEFIHKHIINFPTHQRSVKIQRFLYKIMDSIDKDDIYSGEEVECLRSA